MDQVLLEDETKANFLLEEIIDHSITKKSIWPSVSYCVRDNACVLSGLASENSME